MTTATYSLPADYYAFTNLVELLMHVIRHPVTFGSKVPLWPVFSTLRILLTQATTSWELGFEGLSRLITPYFFKISIGLFKGEYPQGRGVK